MKGRTPQGNWEGRSERVTIDSIEPFRAPFSDFAGLAGAADLADPVGSAVPIRTDRPDGETPELPVTLAAHTPLGDQEEMAKSNRKNRRRTPFETGETAGQTPSSRREPPPRSQSPRPQYWLSYRNFLRVIFIVIVFGGSVIAINLRTGSTAPRYRCELIETYPHDPAAFTQGLIIDDSGQFVFESTGRYGESSIRKVDLKTGEILIQRDLPGNLFGEGLARLGDRLYQLTWKEQKILVYDLELNLLETKTLESEQMWGLTEDGTHLIMSDGTSRLRYIDPKTLTFIPDRQLIVKDGRRYVNMLNEMEYANGKLYINIYQTDDICEVDPKTGNVTAMISLVGLWPKRERPADGLMNGIAFNRTRGPGGRMVVTGKLCPKLFEVEFVPEQ